MNASKKIMNQGKSEDATTTVTAPKSSKKLGKAGLGPSKKSVFMGAICVVLILALCIGVAVQQLQPTTVLKIGKTKLNMDDMMYPIYERESKYAPSDELYQMYVGTSIWDTTYLGDDTTIDKTLTNSNGLKIEIINAETEYEVLYQEAIKAKYSLTDDEKKDAVKQAEKALKGLSIKQKLQLCISKKNLTSRFEKRILADRYKADRKKETDKTVDEKTAIADVSKTDLREYDVQFYAFAKSSTDSSTGQQTVLTDAQIDAYKKQLKTIAKKAKTAKDFTTLLGDNTETGVKYDSAEFTEKDGWSDYVSTTTLAKIKKMKNGAISDVIEDKQTGYYLVIKMVNNNSTASYDDACDEAIDTAKQDAYNTWLADLEKKYDIKQYGDVWDDVKIGTVTTSIVTVDDLSKMAESDSSEASSESK